MQNTILSQDELDFLLTGAVKDGPEQAEAAADAPAQAGLDRARPAASASAGPLPEAGAAAAGASSLGFPREARLRFAGLLQEALQAEGEAVCQVRPEQEGLPSAGGWKPCAELVCGSMDAGPAGAGSPDSGAWPCGMQAGVQIDARLAQALLARELGAASYGLAGRVPTRLEQALLRHALRAVPDCLAGALAVGRTFRTLGMAAPAEGPAGPRQACFGFAVRLGSREGRLCVALA